MGQVISIKTARQRRPADARVQGISVQGFLALLGVVICIGILATLFSEE